MSATEFQRQVWRTVSLIPKGEVRSYSWVAKQMGKPKAYRAVGNALNINPMIGIIPCHRVISLNGNIGGFALGSKKKRAMLKLEGVKI